MEPTLLIALAVGPVLLLLHAIYVLDRYEREPIRNMLRYVFFGAIVCLPAAICEILFLRLAGAQALTDRSLHPLLFVFCVFVGVAFIEEFGKRWMLQLCARRDHNIDEPFDWIVYSVSIALGFAVFENILYVFQGGMFTGVMRAFTAVPEHALCGTFMGERLARAAAQSEMGDAAGARRQRLLALAEPALWHGLYDVFALGLARVAGGGSRELSVTLGVLLILTIVLQWMLAFARVRAQQRTASMRTRVPPILISKRLLGRAGAGVSAGARDLRR